MTIIAGAAGFGSSRPPGSLRAMLAASHPGFARPDAPLASLRTSQVRGAAFGIALDHYLPEDVFDQQPLAEQPAGSLFVADARLDNREEVGAALGLTPRDSAAMSDGALLKLAWLRWDDDIGHRLLGDYAFAAWDGEDTLTLVRGPFAQRPLFYQPGRECTVFASLPDSLFAFEGRSVQPDLDHAASIAARLPAFGTRTMFEDVALVPKGHAVAIRAGRGLVRSIYSFRPAAISLRTVEEAGEALRAELDRATQPLLRRSWGKAAAQLSAGRDSSAVATTSALHLARGCEDLLVLTGAPTEPYARPPANDRLYDESPFAASVAHEHANMRHLVCRSYWPVEGDLEETNRLHHGPLFNVANIPWWDQTFRVAAREGASIMLTGQHGNYTISGGGPEHLRDLWQEEGTLAWLRTLVALSGTSRDSWRNHLSISLGPMLPPKTFRGLLRLSGRAAPSLVPSLLREPYRGRAAERARAVFADERPPSSFFAYRRGLMLEADNPEKFSLRRWGIDVRDPTFDRQLAELTFAIPARFLLSAKRARPAFDAAFADRIPATSLALRRRGFQGADRLRHFSAPKLRAIFARCRSHPAAAELVDFDAVDQALTSWPDVAAEGAYPRADELFAVLGIVSFLASRFQH